MSTTVELLDKLDNDADDVDRWSYYGHDDLKERQSTLVILAKALCEQSLRRRCKAAVAIRALVSREADREPNQRLPRDVLERALICAHHAAAKGRKGDASAPGARYAPSIGEREAYAACDSALLSLLSAWVRAAEAHGHTGTAKCEIVKDRPRHSGMGLIQESVGHATTLPIIADATTRKVLANLTKEGSGETTVKARLVESREGKTLVLEDKKKARRK